MTATAWTRTKVKAAIGRRKLRVPGLVSESAPGIALQEGEWADFDASKNKPTLDVKHGYRPIVIATGAICGPIFEDLDKASEYAVAVSKLADWHTAGWEVPGPLYAQLMRLWYPAAGKKLTASIKRKLAALEAKPEGVANA